VHKHAPWAAANIIQRLCPRLCDGVQTDGEKLQNVFFCIILNINCCAGDVRWNKDRRQRRLAIHCQNVRNAGENRGLPRGEGAADMQTAVGQHL